jgi:hypothetical protein
VCSPLESGTSAAAGDGASRADGLTARCQSEKSRRRDGTADLPSTADIFEERCYGVECQEATYAPQQTASYSITSSASASSVGGMSIPTPLAVARLMTSSNLVGCSTGRSAGFSPLRIRPV